MQIQPRIIRAPRGTARTCKGWPQEAALRMLMNNLDPEVAERPQDLRAKVGVGTGVRWRSPVGPVEAAIAYGVQAKRFRLHFSAGFVF